LEVSARASPLLESSMSLTPGDVIDNKYEIVRLLGEGGMGAVFEGRNRLIERRVAIKVLHAAAREAAGVVERFEREARAAGLIGGDHILEVLDLGTLPTGDRYMVLEFLDGETLAQRITRRGRLTSAEVAPLLRQALVGLRGAHAAGIVHRDLKPDNLFILKEKAGHKDFLKIIDFGVSKFGGPSSEFRMTRTGSVMGTPYYMSPEQAKGAASVNHQSDLYSLGVIAFEAVTGKVPFDGTSFNDLMFKIVLNEMPDLQQVAPSVDAKFSAIIRRAMAKEMERRYPNCDAFLADIDDYLRGVDGGAVSGFGPPTSPLGQEKRTLGQGPRTHAEWSKTNGDREFNPAPRSKTPLYVAAGLAISAAVAVGAWFAARGPTEELVPEPAAPASASPATPSLQAPGPAPASNLAPTLPREPEKVALPSNEPSPSPDTTSEVDSKPAAATKTAPASGKQAARSSRGNSSSPSVVSTSSQLAVTTVPTRAPDPPPRVSEPEPQAKETPAPVRPVEKSVKKPTSNVRDFGY
jgi:eukaryotic-like serine/threonine-protein kinase